MDEATAPSARIGLMLSGGGARAAYQAGVLLAIAEMLPRGLANPFAVICGTSAGAINAAALATNAADFRRAVRGLMSVWRNIHVHQIYRSDFPGMAICGARWVASWVIGALAERTPVSLLDNSPLKALLEQHVDFGAVRESVAAGHLDAFAVTASGYTTGQSITFYVGNDALMPWKRARRVGFRTDIGIAHLMASSAIPFVFPAVRINREYFGDGSIRQIAPVSPALQLGAERVLVIAAGRIPREQPQRIRSCEYPTLAQIAGHALSSVFLDTLEADLGLLPPEVRAAPGMALRPVEYLVLSPSEDIEPLAQRHAGELPRSVRLFLRGIGALRRGGATLVSYLLFERGYCRALIRLGYHDTLQRREEVLRFLQGTPAAAAQRVRA